MPLPSGVTLIPRKTVSKVASNFPLLGRNSNTVAGDDYLFGNPYNAHPSIIREYTKRIETLRADGELSVAVAGEDIRAWIRVTTHHSAEANRNHIRPGSVVYWTDTVGEDVDFIFPTDVASAGFQPGDQVTFINLSPTYRVDLYLAGTGGVVMPAGGAYTRLRLKAGNVGVSTTLERCYIDATAKTLGWRLVAATAAIGTLFDANPIGTGA